MNSGADTEQENEYERVLEALEPGMIVQFNSSDPTSMTTRELHVQTPWNGRKLWLSYKEGAECFVEQKPDGEFALYDEHLGGQLKRRVTDVWTIEVVGVE